MTLRSVPLVLLALLVLVSPALAAAGPPDPVLDLARVIYDGVMSGQYFAAAAGALVLAVSLARRFGAPLVPWLATDAGGAVLSLGGSLGGSLLTAALAGEAVSLGLIWTAAVVAFFASGGYSTVKRLVIAPLRARSTGWPSWARALLALVAWVFDRPDPQARIPTAPVLAVLVVALSVGGCATARRAGAVGANTALVCQTESLSGLAFEAYGLARQYLATTISGDGSVDLERVRVAARQVHSDAGRCAFAAALAAFTDAMSQRRSVLGVGPSEAYRLHQEMRAIARDWNRPVIVDGVRW